jgi:hypothetical protein
MEQQDKAINNIRLQTNILNKAQLILLFNLYDNRFIHEKFLDQIFENLIENKQMIQYDFQEKIYSLYPENNFHNSKLFSKLKALSILSLIYVLLRYVRYKKLISENFLFLKIYLKTISKIFQLRLPLLFILIRKNLRFSKIKLYRAYKNFKRFIFKCFILTFNYLDYKVILNKKLSNKSYIVFYNSDKL